MKKPNGPGILRYDITSDSCYNRYMPNVDDDLRREYYITSIEYSRNIAVSSPGTKQIYILNWLSLAVALSVVQFTDAVGYVGSVADLTFDPSQNLLITCSSVDPNKACTVIDYTKISPIALKTVQLPTGAAAGAAPALTAQTQVWVAAYPQSNYIALSWLNYIYIADVAAPYATTAAAPQLAAYVARAEISPALSDLKMINTEFEYTDVYALTGRELKPIRLFDNAPPYRCFEGCVTAAANNCPQNSFQSAGCDTGKCSVAGYSVGTGALPCKKTMTNQLPFGGLYIRPVDANPVNSAGKVCTGGSGENPGILGVGGDDSALIAILVLAGSVLCLAAVGALMCAAMGGSGGGFSFNL